MTHCLRFASAALALLVVAAGTPAAAQPSGPAPAPAASAAPDAPYLVGLDARERDLLWRVAKGELCPCPGSTASLARCIEEGKACASADAAAHRLRDWLREGLGYDQLVDRLITFMEEQARKPKTFDLSQTACVGPVDAPIQLVSYSDFECPFCRKAATLVHEILARYPGKVRHCFKHFPLDYHVNSGLAASVAVLLQGKGKFWQFHDSVFAAAGRDELDEAFLRAQAAELGLPLEGHEQDLAAASAVVRADRAEGVANGVRGTPSFFVNGFPTPEREPLEAALPRMFDEVLRKAGAAK